MKLSKIVIIKLKEADMGKYKFVVNYYLEEIKDQKIITAE